MIKSKNGMVEVVGAKRVVLVELALLINTLSSKLTKEEIMESVNHGLEMKTENRTFKADDISPDIENFMELAKAIVEGRM